MNGQIDLPSGVVAYRRTPVFTEDTIPAGLRREHRTKPGVWGLITVLDGRLRFRALPSHAMPQDSRLLSAGERIVIAPDEPHEVEPDGPVRFFVEFYRSAETNGSDNETGTIAGETASPA